MQLVTGDLVVIDKAARLQRVDHVVFNLYAAPGSNVIVAHLRTPVLALVIDPGSQVELLVLATGEGGVASLGWLVAVNVDLRLDVNKR